MPNPEINRLLDKMLTLEHNAQTTTGAIIQTKSKQFMSEPDEYELSEAVPTMAEFLELCEVVGTMLELLGGEPTGK